ncbi:MAG: hypothetical protein K2X55_19420 [Burkholderiaceae bacterium]|nr:hypothetical protein [Burkholderiaceae bacterium]
MHLKALSIIFLMLPISCVAAPTLDACQKNSNHPYCWLFFVKTDVATVHQEPNLSSKALESLPIGRTIRINWKKSRKSKNWVYFEHEGTKNGGWIESGDLAGNLDFKAVNDCWPIHRFIDENPKAGDFSFSATMQRNGVAKTDYYPGKVRIWLHGKLLLIGKEPNNNAILYVYDHEKKTLMHPGLDYEVENLEWFSEKEMVGCIAPVAQK